MDGESANFNDNQPNETYDKWQELADIQFEPRKIEDEPSRHSMAEAFDGGEWFPDTPSNEDSNEKIKQKIEKAREAALNAYKKDNEITFGDLDQSEISQMIDKIEYTEDPTYRTNIIEDYRDEYENSYKEKFGSKDGIQTAIEQFNKLSDKNDLGRLRKIQELFRESRGYKMELPQELMDFSTKLNSHIQNLQQIKDSQGDERYGSLLLQEREDQAAALAEQQRQEQEKQLRRAELLEEPTNKLQELRSLYNSLDHEYYPFRDRNERLYQEMRELGVELTNCKSIDEFTERDIDRLGELNSRINSAIQKFSEEKQWQDQEKERWEKERQERESFKPTEENSNFTETAKNTEVQDSDQIDRIKAEIRNYSDQINKMLEYFRPYERRVPVIEREMLKVATEDHDINMKLEYQANPDYQKLAERKQALVNYLNKAKDFMDKSLNQKPQTMNEQPSSPLAQEQPTAQELPDDFWSDFEQPKEEKKQEGLPDGFWDEFDKPVGGGIFRGTKYNSDGTYTTEYMAHLAASSPGIEQEVMKQLQEYNDSIRLGKNNT